ncbi:nicotinate-nucleotide--dimethylbenzimidazole phosphoribosyltransferase [Streptomyces odontomachi]|uniref:nicotinate-nucleotide--dimethylbenzimidazole phosphoribosyltransferase n=1 Tax=Streptomyces odontomachi TaxID=2944940 RepID=UPI00210C91EC|nr:nicotinate-nucleotide--dimethylbenzimidazole phosphoribosyltransferase [Streptomyces sp. ODS25]
MTDTGRIPAEGLPEDVGSGVASGPAQGPEAHAGAHAPGAHPHHVETSAPLRTADDVLLLPDAQNAWHDGQAPAAPAGERAHPEHPEHSGMPVHGTAAQGLPEGQNGQNVPALPDAQSDPGLQDAQNIQGIQNIQNIQNLSDSQGLVAPQGPQGAQLLPETPGEPMAQDAQAGHDEAVAPTTAGAQPEGETPGTAGAPDEPGAHEAGGRDSGSVDVSEVRTQARQQTPVRRPLHLGPPVPDPSASLVRPLSDRGPASTSAPRPQRRPVRLRQATAPDAPETPAAGVPATAETPTAVAAGFTEAHATAEPPASGQPLDGGESLDGGQPSTVVEPVEAMGAHGVDAMPAPAPLDDPTLAGPQLGALPPYEGEPWSASGQPDGGYQPAGYDGSAAAAQAAPAEAGSLGSYPTDGTQVPSGIADGHPFHGTQEALHDGGLAYDSGSGGPGAEFPGGAGYAGDGGAVAHGDGAYPAGVDAGHFQTDPAVPQPMDTGLGAEALGGPQSVTYPADPAYPQDPGAPEYAHGDPGAAEFAHAPADGAMTGAEAYAAADGAPLAYPADPAMPAQAQAMALAGQQSADVMVVSPVVPILPGATGPATPESDHPYPGDFADASSGLSHGLPDESAGLAASHSADAQQPMGHFVPVEGSVPTTPHLAPTPPHALRIPQPLPDVAHLAGHGEPGSDPAAQMNGVGSGVPSGVDMSNGDGAEGRESGAITPDEAASAPAAEPTPDVMISLDGVAGPGTAPAGDGAPGPAGDAFGGSVGGPMEPEAAVDVPAPGTGADAAGTEIGPEEGLDPADALPNDAFQEPGAGNAWVGHGDGGPTVPAPRDGRRHEPTRQHGGPAEAMPAEAVHEDVPLAPQATGIDAPAESPQGPLAQDTAAVPGELPDALAAPEAGTTAEPGRAQDANDLVAVDGADPAPVAEAGGAVGFEAAADVDSVTGSEAAPAPGYAEAEREAVLRVMRERRDIRNGFRSDPIPPDVLLRVLEAAHAAPSVGHSQPWDFVVIRSAETRHTMHELAMRQRDAYAKSLPKGRAKKFKALKVEAILETPVNIVVTADPTRGGRHTLGRHTQPQMAPYSAALAVENLWLAARAEGLGVGWVSFFDEREMVRTLGLPEHLDVVAYLCVGYVDEFPDEPELMQAGWSQRRPLAWAVHEESYGRRALPGAEPHDLLAETIAGIRPLDAKALGEAWERQKRMTKPSGALGILEIISAQLSGLSRMCPPPIPEPAAVAIFAGDHGVHAQGVTPWPQEVTGQMVANFLGGGAVCNAFASQVGAEVCVIDVGVASDLPATPGLLPRKVRAGTADMTAGPALTREEVKAAIEVGIETARDLVAAGNKALLTGEMGIANTTVSAALIAVFTGADPAEVTGRGTGVNDETLSLKTDVVRRALELHQPDPTDPIGVLAAVGGLEHAAMAGLLLGGASLRTPVVLDGVSAGASALVARAIAPEVLAACIAGHRSAEPGHQVALTKLGLRPLIDLDLRLGEGTGALLALPLIQSTARAMHEVATFDSAGVTEK